MTRAHHLTGVGQSLAMMLGRRRRRALGIEARREQQALDEITSGSGDVGHAVRAAPRAPHIWMRRG